MLGAEAARGTTAGWPLLRTLLQLPDIDCGACTLRLTQISPNDDEYDWCADITLSGARRRRR
jgi:hypothetical protein